MDARIWIPSLFAALALVFGGLALSARFGLTGGSRLTQATRWRIALIFAAVSLFLFLYL